MLKEAMPVMEDLSDLDLWFKYEFYPYFERLENSFALLTLNSSANDYLLNALNNKAAEICAFESYLMTNPNRFKINAHNLQKQRVATSFQVLKEKINYLFGKSFPDYAPVKEDTNIRTFKYDPIIIQSEFIAVCDKYVAKEGIPAQNPVNTGEPIQVTNPPKTTVETQPTTPTTLPATNVATQKKNPYWWLWLIGAYGVYRLTKD